MTLRINTRLLSWQKSTIGYDDILLFCGYRLDTVATVNCFYPRDLKLPEVSMFRGMTIPAVDGLIINCTVTNNA